MIFAANVSEDDLADDGNSNELVAKVREYASAENGEVFVICAQIEQEIAELDDDEKMLFLEELGLNESGLEKLIKASYKILGLISYLTSGEDETRAWTIQIGTKAPGAAGKIHSDFERGFIKAEVVGYQDLLDCKSIAAAKEKGLVRIEGKEYVVFHPRLNRVCLLWISNGSKNLLYDMEGDDDFIYDVQNLAFIGEL